MKLLMTVFVIRFVMALVENKSKGNKTKNADASDGNATHPAGYRIR